MNPELSPERRPVPAPFPVPVVEVDQEGYERLTKDVRALIGFDLAQYKPAQVWRRVNAFASARGFASPDALIVQCRLEPALRTALRDMITINVSEFFRNPEAWETLRTRFLVPMLRQDRLTRVWSAGCSFGYEPYSVAILVREQAPGAMVRIQASDLDESILAQARASRYTETQMVGVSDGRRARFFRPAGDQWEVRPELRGMVTFSRHDLLRDRFDAGFDMITCRNVVIYFTEVAKSELYRKFSAALRPGGVLFIGATEAISNPRDAGLEPVTPGFYERPAR